MQEGTLNKIEGMKGVLCLETKRLCYTPEEIVELIVRMRVLHERECPDQDNKALHWLEHIIKRAIVPLPTNYRLIKDKYEAKLLLSEFDSARNRAEQIDALKRWEII